MHCFRESHINIKDYVMYLNKVHKVQRDAVLMNVFLIEFPRDQWTWWINVVSTSSTSYSSSAWEERCDVQERRRGKGSKGETNYTLNLDLQGPKDEQPVSFYKSSRFASISRRATGGASVRQQRHSLEPEPDLTQSRSRRKGLPHVRLAAISATEHWQTDFSYIHYRTLGSWLSGLIPKVMIKFPFF